MTSPPCTPPAWTPACTDWQVARLRADACTYFRVTPEELNANMRDAVGTASVWNYLRWAECEWEYGWPQAVADGVRDFGCESVLDFGSGVGEIALHVAGWNDCAVTMCDLRGPWVEFAAWRRKRREYLSMRGPVHPYEGGGPTRPSTPCCCWRWSSTCRTPRRRCGCCARRRGGRSASPA